jgi:hypothetical protein
MGRFRGHDNISMGHEQSLPVNEGGYLLSCIVNGSPNANDGDLGEVITVQICRSSLIAVYIPKAKADVRREVELH